MKSFECVTNLTHIWLLDAWRSGNDHLTRQQQRERRWGAQPQDHHYHHHYFIITLSIVRCNQNMGTHRRKTILTQQFFSHALNTMR